MVKRSAEIIPCGGIIRRKRNLSLDKPLEEWHGRVRVQGHRHGGRVNVSQYAGRLKKETYANSRRTASSAPSPVPPLLPFSNDTKKR
jgi:hypothetical protein